MRRSSRTGSLHPRSGGGVTAADTNGKSSDVSQDSTYSSGSDGPAKTQTVEPQMPFILPLNESLPEEENHPPAITSPVREKEELGLSSTCVSENVRTLDSLHGKENRDDSMTDTPEAGNAGKKRRKVENHRHGGDETTQTNEPVLTEPNALDETQDQETNFVDEETSYFKTTMKQAGVLLDGESSLILTGGFSASSTVSSFASIVASVRTTLRGKQRVEAFLRGFEEFLGNETNLKRALASMRLSASCTTSAPTISSEPSLIRLLLKVENIQAQLLRSLLDVFLSRALEEVPDDEIPRKIMQNISWLDFVIKPSDLAEHLLQVLRGLSETENCWLKDTVQFLPEVLPDSEHGQAVAHLSALLHETRESVAPFIDALCALSIPPETANEVIQTVLDMLSSAPVSEIPIMIKFLLVACADADPAVQTSTLQKMRQRLSYLNSKKEATETTNEVSSNEALVLKEFHHGLLIFPLLCQRFFASIKAEQEDESCMDIWLLIALSHSAAHAETAKSLLRRLALRMDSEEAFARAIVGHRAALEGCLDELLDLAGSFTRIPPQTKGGECLRVFSQKLYRWLFDEMTDARSRQEIVHALVSHCGAGVTGRNEVDSALRCLRSIVRKDSGALALGPFSGYVRSLLNDLDRFDLVQARYLFRIVSRLALVDGEGVDELKILLRKLLISPEPHRQTLGIVGTVQLIACLSPSTTSQSMTPSFLEEKKALTMSKSSKKRKPRVLMLDTQLEDEDESLPAFESERKVDSLVMEVHSRASDVKESMGLIDYMLRETRHPLAFDELGRIVERRAVDMRLVQSLSLTVQEAFEEWFLFDSDRQSRFDNTLQEQTWFGLEKLEEAEGNEISVKILTVLDRAQSDPRYKNRLLLLCPMMRCLLATTSAAGTCPDAILGCPLVLPNRLATDLSASSTAMRDAVCTSFFHASNWMREIVSSFASAPDLSPEMTSVLCARLTSIIQAQNILTRSVMLVPEFCPPSLPNEDSSVSVPSKTRRGSLKRLTSKLKNNDENRTSTSTTTANTKKKKSSTSIFNGMDDGQDEDEDDSSSEDDTQKELELAQQKNSKPKEYIAVSENEDNREDEEGAEDDDTAKENMLNQVCSPELAAARAVASLRELSPNALRLLATPGLELATGDISDETSSQPKRERPTIHVTALRILLESCVFQLNFQLPDAVPGGFLSGKRLNDTRRITSRANDIEPDEMLELVTRYCLPSLRKFVEELCKLILTRAGHQEDDFSNVLSYANIKDAIACIESAATILRKFIRYEPLRRTHEGSALLLRALEKFSQGELDVSSTFSGHRGTFTEDAPLPADAKPMIANALRNVFRFFVKRISESGVLSTAFLTQILILQLLRDVVNLHEEVCESKSEAFELRESLGKLAGTLLRREWMDRPGANACKPTKDNVGVLLDIYHSNSSTPLEAVRSTVNEMKAFLSEDEAVPPKTFTLLNDKSFRFFFASAVSTLVKVRDEAMGDEAVIEVCFVTKLVDVFSECILLTKAGAAAKIPVLRDAIRCGKAFLDMFVKRMMPFLSRELKSNQEGVLQILQILQRGTRHLNNLCTHGKFKKDASVVALTPALRKVMEAFILSTKSMLKVNKCDDGLTIGVLKARNIDGTVVKLDDVVEDPHE